MTSGIKLIRLYPDPGGGEALEGLYLTHKLHEQGDANAPFVYGNFVASLDGRIALGAESGDAETYVPESLTTGTDWRLFQELQAQADCLVTHGGYLRALARGDLDDILGVGGRAGSEELLAWRKLHGLVNEPAVVIASASLDFPMPASLGDSSQKVYIATGAQADRARVAAWEKLGFEILITGMEKAVDAAPLVERLGSLGYRSLYLQTGPQMLESMLRQGVLSRLYLTLSHRLVGGRYFHTMIAGNELGPAGELSLTTLYFCPARGNEAGQLFASFEPAGSPRA